jgi:hypothetical protein
MEAMDRLSQTERHGREQIGTVRYEMNEPDTPARVARARSRGGFAFGPPDVVAIRVTVVIPGLRLRNGFQSRDD